jgi:hypothetical protein
LFAPPDKESFTSSVEGAIVVKVYNKEFFKDELLGEVIITIKDYANSVGHDKWVELKSEPKKKKDPKSGELRLKILFSGTTTQTKEEKSNKIEDRYDIGKTLGR